MAFDSLAIVFLFLWLVTLFAFILYLAGWKKRHKAIIEQHLSEHDQVFLKLQKSEDRYQKLINYMNEGLIFTDDKDIICFVNKCACAILKTSPEKILHRPISDFLISPVDIRKLGLPYELKRHGCSHKEEMQLVRNNGEMFWANLNISYLDILHDHMPGAIIVMTDITEKKATEEKLHKLTLNLNQRVKQLDCLFEISDISNAPGMGLEDVLNKTIEIIPYALRNPSDVWVEIEFDQKKYVSGNFKETNWNYLAPIKWRKRKFGTLRVGYRDYQAADTREVFLINEKILIRNVAEKLARIIELKVMEESLNQGLDEIKHIQEITRIGKWEWPLNNNKIMYSDDFFEVLKVESGKRAGYNPEIFYQFVHPDDLALMKDYVNKVLSSQIDDLSFSFRYRPRPDETLIIMGNGILIRDRDNKLQKIVGTVQDITKQVLRFTNTT
jgi:PAS domain S-box-containing protein